MFPSISPRQSFPQLESDMLAYWKANNTFQKSVDTRPVDDPYRFYDGPPFITGTPHYGSLLSSIVKDVVGRYWTMRGRRVERTWGWDCHGLPIEEKVQKKLGLKSNADIEANGVKKFIDECYAYTSEVSSEWNWYIDKIGRWVDMDHAYRTMDQDYMESVMWVFSELYKKGLVYEGKRVSLYSWKLGTPISNFEVSMDDTYQEVNDPAITVKFALEERTAAVTWILNEEGKFLLGYSKKYNAWKLVGGKKEDDETIEQCAIREAKEEIGIDIHTLGTCILKETQYTPRGVWTGVHYQVQVHTDDVINSEPEKFKEWKWFTKEELVSIYDDIFEVDRYAIDIYLERGDTQKYTSPVYVLAWTTTPWTIPANMALAVRSDIVYVLVANGGEQYIVAKNRVDTVFKGKGEYVVIREIPGSDLVGLGYIPPFPEYYYQKDLTPSPSPKREENTGRNHKIYHADFITDTDGTGIGHEAPEFGDVDYMLARKEGIHISHAMDDAGRYTAEIFDMEGIHYLDLENPDAGANKINIERMKVNNTLFKIESITHRIPFCPRSGTPLMQKAQKSWFIDIQSQKDKLIQANEQINWFPEYLKEGRFKKGIETAPDWCISRTRYWGAPMPVWVGTDGEKLVVSSREEIYAANKAYGQLEKREVDGKSTYYFVGGEYAGTELNLHKPYIDSIRLQNPKAIKAKKVLGVHGWTSRGLSGENFWKDTQNLLEFNNISLEVPDFDKNKETSYRIWKDTFATLDISQYDTIVAHSFGCPVTMQYILENQIHLDRLVLVAPSGLIGNSYLEESIPEMTGDKSTLKNLVKEIIIIHSKDDESTSANFAYGKSLAEEIGAYFLETSGCTHAMTGHITHVISGLIQFGSPLTRIPEVLDVWMDSGSMPYAQMHYPFENREAMQASFPADFIAEYVGQIRAWFYVMHVLGVLLNPTGKSVPTPSFTNVITTGVINGNDGRKMSKSFGNYPDPKMAIEKYGADPIRFYMLNSPLLSGGDMDFREEQIVDTIKGVMLPLWNTYSFFTTYANIDTWKADTTEVWYTRHAESTSNIAGKMSDGTDNPELTEKGYIQAKNAGTTLREQGVKFDYIVHTDLIRTYETAHTIGSTIGYTGEYIVDNSFVEQAYGKYANVTLQQIADMHGLDVKDHVALRRVYKNNTTENIEQFDARILSAYTELLKKYKGKKVLIVAHAGTPRPILHKYMGKSFDEAYYSTSIKNATPFRLHTTPVSSPLDMWILSRLQVLQGQVHDAMDGYDVSRACRHIVAYMDELTNWYIRLSRRRFWESGMTEDKESAYTTLHTVLVEISKLLAPYMPFLSESIYKGLTDICEENPLEKGGRETINTEYIPDNNSVHLQYITRPNPFLVHTDLNIDMDICEKIVSLGLGLRSRRNIRVRQPLQSVTITRTLSEYYKNIICEELNVKVVYTADPQKLAKKICKPDAKKIGPKYGKQVQEIITRAKNGDYIEGENGVVYVGEYMLDMGEYTIEYIPLEGVGDVDGGHGIVISLDTYISEELKKEGYARDMIRTIQDMRKEAGYAVMDRIYIDISGVGSEDILGTYADTICSETLSAISSIDTADLVRTEMYDDIEVRIAVKR